VGKGGLFSEIAEHQQQKRFVGCGIAAGAVNP
jgi:hypothetical protein